MTIGTDKVIEQIKEVNRRMAELQEAIKKEPDVRKQENLRKTYKSNKMMLAILEGKFDKDKFEKDKSI